MRRWAVGKSQPIGIIHQSRDLNCCISATPGPRQYSRLGRSSGENDRVTASGRVEAFAPFFRFSPPQSPSDSMARSGHQPAKHFGAPGSLVSGASVVRIFAAMIGPAMVAGVHVQRAVDQASAGDRGQNQIGCSDIGNDLTPSFDRGCRREKRQQCCKAQPRHPIGRTDILHHVRRSSTWAPGASRCGAVHAAQAA